MKTIPAVGEGGEGVLGPQRPGQEGDLTWASNSKERPNSGTLVLFLKSQNYVLLSILHTICILCCVALCCIVGRVLAFHPVISKRETPEPKGCRFLLVKICG